MSPVDDPFDRRPVGPDLFASVAEDRIRDAAGAERPVWVYESEGLERVGQSELVLAVLRQNGQDRTQYPQFPLWLFAVAQREAHKGATVGPGGRTILGSPGSDVDPRLAGFVYDDHPSPLAHLAASDDREVLTAIPLLSGEIQAAERVGQARVLALLGEKARTFPYPWWFEPGRAAVIDDQGDVEASKLDRLPTMVAHYLEVGLRRVQVEITLPVEESQGLHDALAGGPEIVALLSRIPHTASRHLVWRPGQELQTSIWNVPDRATPPMNSGLELIGGCFLVLGHGELEAQVSAVEDGFAVILSPGLWTQFLSALEQRKPFHCPVKGKFIREVVLRFTSRTHVSPFGEWHTTGEFQLSRPQTRLPDTGKLHNIQLDRTVLLVSTRAMRAAVDAGELGLLIDEMCEIVDDALDGTGPTWSELVANLHLVPGDGVNARVAIRDSSVEQPAVEALVNRLDALTAPAGLRRELLFELWISRAE